MTFANEQLDRIIDKSSDALYTQIVQRIRSWIVEGQLKAGDPLPSERELAQIFDVSRVPVREALKILEFMGAVKHVRGKGVFVQKISMSQVLNSIDFLMADPLHTLLDLFEAREAIELQAVRLAAIRRTDDDIIAMETVLTEMERNIAAGMDVYEPSFKFHTAVIAASHNSIIIKINECLADLLSYSRKQSLKSPTRHEAALDYHKKILQSIKQQDPEKAAETMAQHLLHAKSAINSIQ